MNKILVIEDETELRQNIIEVLENANFDCVGAENGSRGLYLVREFQPNLIICDIMMPDMDGYSVLSELRKDPLTAIIPFIFLTAKSKWEDFRLGMKLGADDYINKPCTPEELIQGVTTRLAKDSLYWQEYRDLLEFAKKRSLTED